MSTPAVPPGIIPLPAPGGFVAAPARRDLRPVQWVPLALVALLYIAACVGPAVFNQNEAQYAGAAREMLNRPRDYQPSARRQSERGQWLVPTNDGVPRLQKPPLVYWTLIAAMEAFGINDFSARLPNAVASLAWFAGIVALGGRLGSRKDSGLRLGLAAATILATMAGTFIFSHLIAPEPFLAAFLTWTFWCLLSACRDPARANRYLNLAWLFMGCGAMTKGLHAVAYPLAVVGLLGWRHPRTRPVWRRLFQPARWLILLAVTVPWYAYIECKYPGFLWDQLVNEQLGHVINHRYPPDSTAVPLPIFGLEHLVLFLPWTFFIPAAWRFSTGRHVPQGWDAVGRDLLTGWLGITCLSIIFSSLQDYYLLTAFGPVAFWLARPWVSPSGEGNPLPRWTVGGPGAAFGLLGLLACGLGIGLRLRGVDVGHATNTYGDRDQIWATVQGFSVDAWRHVLPLLGGTGLAFLAGGVVVVFLATCDNRPAILAATALMMIVVLALAVRGMCVLEDYFSLKRVSLLCNRLASPDAIAVRYGPTFNSPSLLYYLDREVYWLDADPDGEFASRRLGINRRLFLNEENFSRQWASTSPVFLCIEDDDLEKLRRKVSFTPAQLDPLARFGTTLLLSNRPRGCEGRGSE